MYNRNEISKLVKFIQDNNGINDKDKLKNLVKDKFSLSEDRSIFYNDYFSIRFSKAKTDKPSNTVLSLSKLKLIDDKPFIVCLVLKQNNVLLLSNSTFISKISHSSHKLSLSNIKGSFNASDILRSFNEIKNEPTNFYSLFDYHTKISFQDNLARIVNETNEIQARDLKYKGNVEKNSIIINSPLIASKFISSKNYALIKEHLDKKVYSIENDLQLAALIDNVNLRGRLIEYLLTSEENDDVRKRIIYSLRNKTSLPELFTDDKLGDIDFEFNDFIVNVDIKSKLLSLKSAPKAFNVDKMLEFLSSDTSVYLIFLVGISENNKIKTELVSIFDVDIMKSTRFQTHWAGRDSRGVAQFNGDVLDKIIKSGKNKIDIEYAKKWLKNLIDS